MEGGRCVTKRGGGTPGISAGVTRDRRQDTVVAGQRARARYQQGIRPAAVVMGAVGGNVIRGELFRSEVGRNSRLTAGVSQTEGAATAKGEGGGGSLEKTQSGGEKPNHCHG